MATKRKPDTDMTQEDEVLIPDDVLDGTLIIHEDDDVGQALVPQRKYSPEERKKLVLALRLSGATFGVIAQQFGVTRETVTLDYGKAIQELGTEDVATLRITYQARLEQLLQTRWQKALGGDDSSLGAVLMLLDRIERLYGLNGAPLEEANDTDSKLIILSGDTSSFRAELEEQKKNAKRA